jgi:hypothetical protein
MRFDSKEGECRMKRILRIMLFACLGLGLVVGPAGAVYHKHTVYQIRQGLVTLNDSVLVDSVKVIGIDVRPSTFGVYVQAQAGGPFSGILAYRGGTFPAYDNDSHAVTLGDLITVKGIYTEFASAPGSLSEINNPILSRISTGPPVTPVNVTVSQINNNNPAAEQWEGVLVKVSNVKVTFRNNFNNWYFHALPCAPCAGTDSTSGYQKMNVPSQDVIPAVGDTLTSVTGVAQWENNERRIAPRNGDDIKFLRLPAPVPNLVYSSAENKIKVFWNVTLNQASAQNTANYALSTFEVINSAVYDSTTDLVTLTTATNLVPSTTPVQLTVNGVRNLQNRIMAAPVVQTFIGGISTINFAQTPKSAVNDTSQVVNRQVSIRGVVTEETGKDFPSSIGGFYVQQRNATQYSGLFVFGAPVSPARNDSVFVSGLITEFGIGPETELTSVDEVTIYSHNRPPIQPLAVTIADINGKNLSQAEKYEECLVKISGVTTTATVVNGEPFDVVQGVPKTNPGGPYIAVQDTMRVDDLAIVERDFGSYAGMVLDVMGITRISGTLPFRRLQPRNWREPPAGDIHMVSSPVSGTPGVAYRTYLHQNHPNPFNPATEIQFSVAQAGPVLLRLYDVQGRLVATLVNRKLPAGPNRAVWNGRDPTGRQVETGVYFYRLEAAGVDLTKKLVLIK